MTKYLQINNDISCGFISFHLKYIFQDIVCQIHSCCDTPIYNKIIPNVYVGNLNGVNNENLLKELGITQVISVMNFTPKQFEYITYYHLNIKDNLVAKDKDVLYENLDYFVEVINGCVTNNEPVFIHCHYGSQRSCALVCAYLIKHHQASYYSAIKFIKKQHPHAFLFFNHFEKQLIRYQHDMENKEWDIL